jgi:lipopolysaccharide/colanic/teichoic acid biosynthesis glycosyltransferase
MMVKHAGHPKATRDYPVIIPAQSTVDELPQLFIIPREMSIIGRAGTPRIRRTARDHSFYRMRHLVKPGLTGWAQIN